jgi:hypothetical protein
MKQKGTMAKSKKTAATKIVSGSKAHSMESMDYWRDQARGLLPEEKSDKLIGIVATWAKLQAGLLIQSWKDVRDFSDDNEVIAIAFSVKVDQSKTPPTVKIKMSYNEPHTWNAESEVPDENQKELPGVIDLEPKHVVTLFDPDDATRARRLYDKMGDQAQALVVEENVAEVTV